MYEVPLVQTRFSHSFQRYVCMTALRLASAYRARRSTLNAGRDVSGPVSSSRDLGDRSRTHARGGRCQRPTAAARAGVWACGVWHPAARGPEGDRSTSSFDGIVTQVTGRSSLISRDCLVWFLTAGEIGVRQWLRPTTCPCPQRCRCHFVTLHAAWQSLHSAARR